MPAPQDLSALIRGGRADSYPIAHALIENGGSRLKTAAARRRSSGRSANGKFLTDNGLELYFSSTRDGDHADSDLYVAHRTATDANFGEPEPPVDLNDPWDRSEERMPWLSPDGQQLYFASDRSGQYALYVAHKLP